jgi:hypothetical protein
MNENHYDINATASMASIFIILVAGLQGALTP